MASGYGGALSRLNRKMARTIPTAVRRASGIAAVAAAEEVARLQRSLAPVDSGDLRASIHVTPPGASTPPYSQPGGSIVAREGQAIITAGNVDVRYPHLVEYGTAPHTAGGKFEGAQIPAIPAQPFFWPAYRALRRRAKGKIMRAISKAIKDGAK